MDQTEAWSGLKPCWWRSNQETAWKHIQMPRLPEWRWFGTMQPSGILCVSPTIVFLIHNCYSNWHVLEHDQSAWSGAKWFLAPPENRAGTSPFVVVGECPNLLLNYCDYLLTGSCEVTARKKHSSWKEERSTGWKLNLLRMAGIQ